MIDKQGFQKYSKRVTVDVASKVVFSAKLAVTGVSTTVEVTASGETATVNTETQTLSDVVTGQQLADLPTLTRNPYDLVATSGNVSDGDDGQAGRGVGFAINGQRAAEPTSSSTAAKTLTCLPPALVRAFRSIQCRNSAFRPATLPRSTAAPGWRGERHHQVRHQPVPWLTYEFNRVSALASNNYNNNAPTLGDKPGFTRNQFGYSIGGPIVKNKLFFFSATEWTRVRSSATIDQVFLIRPS